MSEPILRPRSASLRLVALRLALPELAAVARQPDVIDALRITVQYHGGRQPDQVATLVRERHSAGPRLTVAYRRATDRPLVLTLSIETARAEAFGTGLRRLNFDRLDDQPDIPWFGEDLWLVERAAGAFHHDVIIAPESATGPHADIVGLTRTLLHEAVRTIHI
jgi:hypothetical protein